MAGGCCTPKDGSSTCPVDGKTHENNEYYEQWRMKCDSDDCNTQDPRCPLELLADVMTLILCDSGPRMVTAATTAAA